ncbi:hypothetical protein ACHAWF_001895, partial [Thalassiosira exigua]
KWNGRKKLQNKIPTHVEDILKKKDLMSEYEQLVNHLVELGLGNNRRKWDSTSVQAIVKEHQPAFSAKGIDIYFSRNNDYVDKAVLHFRWIEFVDREEQPTYHPQYDAETKRRDCFTITR